MKSTRRFAAALHNSVDGGELKESRNIPQQRRWIAEGTRFLSGRDFVLTCKLRINAHEVPFIEGTNTRQELQSGM